jgi:hypothetical protein
MSSIYNQSPSAHFMLLAAVLLSLAVAVPVETDVRAAHIVHVKAGSLVPEAVPQVQLIQAQAKEDASPKKVIDAVTASQVAESAALTAQANLKAQNLKAATAMKNAMDAADSAFIDAKSALDDSKAVFTKAKAAYAAATASVATKLKELKEANNVRHEARAAAAKESAMKKAAGEAQIMTALNSAKIAAAAAGASDVAAATAGQSPQ